VAKFLDAVSGENINMYIIVHIYVHIHMYVIETWRWIRLANLSTVNFNQKLQGKCICVWICFFFKFELHVQVSKCTLPCGTRIQIYKLMNASQLSNSHVNTLSWNGRWLFLKVWIVYQICSYFEDKIKWLRQIYVPTLHLLNVPPRLDECCINAQFAVMF
jgi:hypothetical protein